MSSEDVKGCPERPFGGPCIADEGGCCYACGRDLRIQEEPSVPEVQLSQEVVGSLLADDTSFTCSCDLLGRPPGAECLCQFDLRSLAHRIWDQSSVEREGSMEKQALCSKCFGTGGLGGPCQTCWGSGKSGSPKAVDDLANQRVRRVKLVSRDPADGSEEVAWAVISRFVQDPAIVVLDDRAYQLQPQVDVRYALYLEVSATTLVRVHPKYKVEE